MERKMNILMIPTWYSPLHAEVLTAGVFHYEQSIALQKYCNMALYYPCDKDLGTNFVKNEERGLLTYRSRFYSGKVWKYIRWILDFRKIKKEFQPDVLHAHVASMAGRLAILLGTLYRIPVVITEHNAVELMGLESRKTRTINQFTYGCSKANVSVSRHSMKCLQEHFPKEKFQVIHNGVVNPNAVQDDGVVYAKEKRINCCIIAAFYHKEAKGYQYLLPAIKELIEKGFPMTLHICGGGEHQEYYMQMAKDLDILEYCIFYGSCKREKAYSIIRQMNFCISASLYESAGISVQESMLLGKPLVVTKSGGANSLVTTDTAIVVDRGSVSALVDGMKNMIDRLPTFDSEQIQTYAFSNFEIDEVSKQYVELYKGILEKK